MNDLDVCMMTLDEARRVTERIRIQATNVRDGLEKLQEHVDAAKAGKAWEVLGYKSWTAYLADVMGEEPLRLSRDDRREVVELLAGEGMSTRAIAPIVGVQHSAVAKDLRRSGVSTGHTSSSGPSAPSAPSPESTVRDSRTVEPSYPATVPPVEHGGDADSRTPLTEDTDTIRTPVRVTGMDGKTYTRPTPAPEDKPRKTPLPKTFTSAVLDVQRRLKTLRDLTTEDRWPANKNQVATMHGSDLERINDLLQEIRQSLSN